MIKLNENQYAASTNSIIRHKGLNTKTETEYFNLFCF